LVERSWITVEKKAMLAIGVCESIGNQRIREGVGDIFAPIHKSFGLDAEGRFVADVRSKDIARRNRRDGEGVGQENRLSPLTGPRGTNEEHADH
jgi:hypothetical protein